MSEGFKPVSRTSPCPVCTHVDWCGVSASSGFVRCMRFARARPGWDADYVVVKEDAEGGVVLRPKHAMAVAAGAYAAPITPGQRNVGPKDYTDLARLIYEQTDDEKRAEHARDLGVSVESLRLLRVGWWAQEKCWAWPNRDDRMRVAGINRRFVDGDKRIEKFGGNKAITRGHKQGVYSPPLDHHRSRPSEIMWCPEGGSDVAALLTMGMLAIGRASNKAKADVVASLAKGRRLIIIGENDRKPDGTWPGQEGAIHSAKIIGGLWNETVEWAMMPEGYKDVREWLRKHCPDPENVGMAKAAGESLAAALIAGVKELHPGQQAPGETVAFTNVFEERGSSKPKYISIGQIAGNLAGLTDRWPRRSQGQLFAITHETPVGKLPVSSQVWKLDNADALFAWLQNFCAPRWMTKDCVDGVSGAVRTPVRKRELFEWLAANAKPNYRMIEILPHHPPVSDSFYVPFELPEGDGSALQEFASMINAETEDDRWLAVAAAITPAWGGPCGARPAFLFTSDHGRGVGKTATAELIADLWGGAVSGRENEDWEHLLARLLDDGSLDKRVVFIDNIKRYMSSSGMESAVTAQSIDGKRMYFGQFSRPNRLTWMMSANAPSLSADLTTRSIPIKIGTANHDSDFQVWRAKFLAERRLAFIADCVTILKGEPAGAVNVDRHDRWREWILNVLCKLPDPQRLIDRAIAGRQVIDSDAADAGEVVDVIRGVISGHGWDPDKGQFSIVKQVLAAEMNRLDVGPKKASPNRLSRWFKAMGPLGQMARLSEDPDKTYGRAWRWVGESELDRDRIWITTAPPIQHQHGYGAARFDGDSSGVGPGSDPGPGKVHRDAEAPPDDDIPF